MKVAWFVCEHQGEQKIQFLNGINVEKNRDNSDGSSSILVLIGDVSTDFCVKHLKQLL